MSCKCIEALSREHQTLLKVAGVLESMSKRVQTHSEYDQQDVEAMLRILRAYGDDFHQAKEEGILFPIFTGLCDASQRSAVRHILFEHAQDRALMNGMEDAIARSNAPQFAEYAERLAALLRAHTYKEDNILFEIVTGVLTGEDDARIMTEFEAFDRDFRAEDAGKLLEQLRVLEWKYLHRITQD
jgi:hemerythrin-like domain-containing protein